MADYCKQCSINLFDLDYRELAKLSKPEDTEKGIYAEVICEGCGFTYVDHEGICVNPNCMEQHGKKSLNPTDKK